MPELSEKKRLLRSLIVPAVLLGIIWLVKLYEIIFHADFSDYGIIPQTITGLRGIIFAPLLHADASHAFANSAPLFILTAALFYYYGRKAAGVFVWSWLITGFWVWVFAKDTGCHIGASGVVYALAAFHFAGGVLRREPRMMAFSLLVVFLYGGLVWGLYPDFWPEKNISWQSHLLGMVAGIILAFFYRYDGPQRRVYEWEDEEEENDDPLTDTENPEKKDIDAFNDEPVVTYHLRKRQNDGDTV